MTIFIILASVIFLFLGSIWRSSNGVDLLVKIVLFIMVFFGAYLLITGNLLSEFIK